MTRQWVGSRCTELAGGFLGGFVFAGSVWFTRRRLAPLLRQDNHAIDTGRYDPVGAVVTSIEKLRKKAGKT